jgi:hypothetical protein
MERDALDWIRDVAQVMAALAVFAGVPVAIAGLVRARRTHRASVIIPVLGDLQAKEQREARARIYAAADNGEPIVRDTALWGGCRARWAGIQFRGLLRQDELVDKDLLIDNSGVMVVRTWNAICPLVKERRQPPENDRTLWLYLEWLAYETIQKRSSDVAGLITPASQPRANPWPTD